MTVTKLSISTFLLLFSCILIAQLVPQDYYKFPINPGQQALLSGNMGELRSNHFHAGLDIKTGGVEGLPVYCSADGFVSRIKVSSFGYGLCLYVEHPNGQTTVYAHLSKFKDDLQKKVTDYQYQTKSYEAEVFPAKTEFVVKKGEIIGRSGNSGGSGGPHLHWEIRDAYSRPLNPLLAKFTEVKDNITPVIYKVGFTTLSSNAHFNNEFGFFTLTPSKTSLNTYILKDVKALGEIGLALNANDKLNGTSNNNGIAGISVYVADKLSFEYYNDKFTFADGKMINHHIEYDRYKEGYGHFHRCYVADGNSLSLYKSNESHGILKIEEGKTYPISVKIWDAYNNESNLKFNIIGAKIGTSFAPVSSTAKKVKQKVFENILRVNTSNNGAALNYYKFGQSYTKEPLYLKGDEAIYTFDLRKELPDSIKKGNIRYNFSFSHFVIPNADYTSYNKNAIVRFPKGCIKDTLYFEYNYKNDVFEIGDENTPLYQNINIILKPQLDYPNKAKTAAYLVNGTSNSYVGGDWMGNHLEFKNNKLGTYKLLTDIESPTIQLVTRNSKYIKLKIGDNLSGIKNWNASLDGNYLLMSYRYQTGILESILQNENNLLKGLFKIEVEDNVGNKKTYSIQL
jgi:Peptidase family M23